MLNKTISNLLGKFYLITKGVKNITMYRNFLTDLLLNYFSIHKS